MRRWAASWTQCFVEAGLTLPGDVTLDQVAAGLNDPELMLYLRRLPELSERDRTVLRSVLRVFFDEERGGSVRTEETTGALQLALPPFGGRGAPPMHDLAHSEAEAENQ